MRYLILITAIFLSGCNTAEDSAVRACETFIKERLRSPSTYKKISDDGLGPSFKSDGRDVKMVVIEYDAANAYGTPIRGTQQCLFEVDKSGKFLDQDLEHAATMASIGAESEYAPCCILQKRDKASTGADTSDVGAVEAAAQAAMDAADAAADDVSNASGAAKSESH
jgi:hypothetical protein